MEINDLDLDELERIAGDYRLYALDQAKPIHSAQTINRDVILKLIALTRNAESWRQASFRYSDRAERYEQALREITETRNGMYWIMQKIAREALENKP